MQGPKEEGFCLFQAALPEKDLAQGLLGRQLRVQQVAGPGEPLRLAGILLGLEPQVRFRHRGGPARQRVHLPLPESRAVADQGVR